MNSQRINGAPPQVNFAAIPAELQAFDQWVLWKTVIRDGKATKMPLSVCGTAASSTDSATWTNSLAMSPDGKMHCFGCNANSSALPVAFFGAKD